MIHDPGDILAGEEKVPMPVVLTKSAGFCMLLGVISCLLYKDAFRCKEKKAEVV